jgi:hypothetical protein
MIPNEIFDDLEYATLPALCMVRTPQQIASKNIYVAAFAPEHYWFV